MPNDFQIDIWRQTYSTTDSGPTCRLGRNLCVLSPVARDGKVTPLTHFTDGYVADCEVSWDGRRVLFARRGGDADPWWHLFEVNADGTELKQLTDGPYHDVQPAYLPDGRIVFASSRTGLRDEYHGYPATGLRSSSRPQESVASVSRVAPAWSGCGRAEVPALAWELRPVGRGAAVLPRWDRLPHHDHRGNRSCWMGGRHPSGGFDPC